MKWLYLVSSLLSLFGGSVLLLLCCLLWRRKKDQGLLRQLLQLALADIALAILTLVLNCAVMLGVDKFDKEQCGIIVIMFVWIGTNSILYCMILALGILVSALRVKTPLSLRYAAWTAPLLSFLLAVPHVADRGYSDPTWPDLCFAQPIPAAVSGVFVCLLFCGTLVVHTVVLAKSYGAAPHSVVRRVARHALRYLAAFVCTEGALLVLVVAMLLHPNLQGWIASTQWHLWRDVAFLLAHLNGFFNFIAFLGHARGMRKRKRRVRTVAFRDQGGLDDVQEISSRPRSPVAEALAALDGAEGEDDSADSFVEELLYRFSFDDSPVHSSQETFDSMPSVLMATSEFQSRRAAEEEDAG